MSHFVCTQAVLGLGDGSFAGTCVIDIAPPADGVPPALPRLTCLQLAEFAIVDGHGDPIGLDWLIRRLGPPGAASPCL